MKIYVDVDERYPDYRISITDDYGRMINIPERTYKRWKRIMSGYDTVQSEIKTAYRHSVMTED